MKTTSCGILVLNPHGEILLGHSTGNAYWDIPKGGTDEGESPVQTAIRETAEEIGLVFEPDDLLDLGRFTYRPRKDLHLFASLLERIDVALCSCATEFLDRRGRSCPEMDAFRWTPYDEVPLRCAKSMGVLLTHAISLPALLKQLIASGHVVKAASEIAVRR